MSTEQVADRFGLRVQPSPYDIGAVKLKWEDQRGAKWVRVNWSYGLTLRDREVGAFTHEYFIAGLPDGAACEFWLTAEDQSGETYSSQVVSLTVVNSLQRMIAEMPS